MSKPVPKPLPLPKPLPPAAAITIHDVARLAGVSIKTVSRVLRDEAHVALATRQTVQQAALRLGYVPHPSARNLASAVSNVIALVSLAPAPKSVARVGHEYLMALQTGVLSVCQVLDFGLMLMALPRQAKAAVAEMSRRVLARQVGGFILPAPACDLRGLLPALDATGLHYAAISPHALTGAGPWVVADERKAFRGLTLHLIEAGHRRIGLLLGDPGTRGAVERLAGYRDALADAGIPFDAALLAPSSYTFDRGLASARLLLNRSPAPSAIVAASDDCAAGVIAAGHERGLSLPDQLSVTGYDDLDLARKVWPGLTTAHPPLEQMAVVATRQLIARMHPHRRTNDLPPAQVMLPAELVFRGSVSRPV